MSKTNRRKKYVVLVEEVYSEATSCKDYDVVFAHTRPPLEYKKHKDKGLYLRVCADDVAVGDLIVVRRTGEKFLYDQIPSSDVWELVEDDG